MEEQLLEVAERVDVAAGEVVLVPKKVEVDVQREA